MTDLNASIWAVLNQLDWCWWGLNSAAAAVSLFIMGRLRLPRSHLGRTLRVTATVGYWFVILSPLMNVGQPVAFPILSWSWTGILFQMWQECRRETPRQMRADLMTRVVRSLVK